MGNCQDCQTASGGILQSGLKNRKKNLIFQIFGIMSVTKNNCIPKKIKKRKKENEKNKWCNNGWFYSH